MNMIQDTSTSGERVRHLIKIWGEATGEKILNKKFTDKDRKEFDTLNKLINLFGYDKAQEMIRRIPAMNRIRRKQVKKPTDLIIFFTDCMDEVGLKQ